MILKFELDDKHVQVISEALGNVPYKHAAPVIVEMQRQINEQLQAKAEGSKARALVLAGRPSPDASRSSRSPAE